MRMPNMDLGGLQAQESLHRLRMPKLRGLSLYLLPPRSGACVGFWWPHLSSQGVLRARFWMWVVPWAGL